MRNGYAVHPRRAQHRGEARAADAAQVDAWRDLLRIGVHWDVEVTPAPDESRLTVSQAFGPKPLHGHRAGALARVRDAGARRRLRVDDVAAVPNAARASRTVF